MPRGIPKNGRRRRRNTATTPKEANLVPAIEVGGSLYRMQGWRFQMSEGSMHLEAETEKRRGGRPRKEATTEIASTPTEEKELVTA